MSSFGRRLASASTDKWGILAAAFGAGVTWAIGLPVVGVAVVGVGMYTAAVATGLLRGRHPEAEPKVDLRRGTPQEALVTTLSGYRRDLHQIVDDGALPSALAPSATAAAQAADDAAKVAHRVAVAVDGLDHALGRTAGLAQQTRGSGGDGVRQSLRRMSLRRDRLLADLESGVGEVAQIYANLLELSTTAGLAGMETTSGTAVSDVNDSLDALREAFAQLEARSAEA